jgi:hypothetical protein
VILQALSVDRGHFEAGTGWTLKPEGLCRGDVCVPLPAEAVTGDGVNVEVVAGRAGMPIVHDVDRGVWALGPAAVTGHTLATAQAPDLELPDRDGNPFKLSSLHGRKVLLVAWASW